MNVSKYIRQFANNVGESLFLLSMKKQRVQNFIQRSNDLLGAAFRYRNIVRADTPVGFLCDPESIGALADLERAIVGERAAFESLFPTLVKMSVTPLDDWKL
jgi:hypothetical protein